MNNENISVKEDVEEFFKSGAAKLDAKLYEESITDFLKTLSINPDHIAANFQICYSLCSLKRYRKALAYADKLIEICPDWDTYEHRAAIKKSLGDWYGAEEDYEIARGIPKDGCM